MRDSGGALKPRRIWCARRPSDAPPTASSATTRTLTWAEVDAGRRCGGCRAPGAWARGRRPGRHRPRQLLGVRRRLLRGPARWIRRGAAEPGPHRVRAGVPARRRRGARRHRRARRRPGGRARPAPDLDLVVVGGEGDPVAATPGASSTAARPRAGGHRPRGLALLLFTSGTSGRAKGAMLSHRALLANVANVADCRDPQRARADDVVLLVLPLFHVYSLNGTLTAVADQAATAVLVERFDRVESLEVVRREGVTNIPGAPPMFVAWSTPPGPARRVRVVRMLFTGAAPMSPPCSRRCAEVRAAGLRGLRADRGRAGSRVDARRWRRRSPVRSVDRLPGVEVRLARRGRRRGRGRRPGRDRGSAGPTSSTATGPTAQGGPDADGWFATGDVAYLDDDGDLVLVDRRKELVIVNGFNVYPREVEDALIGHPDIDEVAVIGMPIRRPGRRSRLYVVPRPGADLHEDAVTAYAATRLARFKCPTIVTFVEHLPHSATGKVAKGRCARAREPRGRPGGPRARWCAGRPARASPAVTSATTPAPWSSGVRRARRRLGGARHPLRPGADRPLLGRDPGRPRRRCAARFLDASTPPACGVS